MLTTPGHCVRSGSRITGTLVPRAESPAVTVPKSILLGTIETDCARSMAGVRSRNKMRHFMRLSTRRKKINSDRADRNVRKFVLRCRWAMWPGRGPDWNAASGTAASDLYHLLFYDTHQ